MTREVLNNPETTLESFAGKYIYYFNTKFNENPNAFLESGIFDQECHTLGFNMDCGHSFCEKYPDAFSSAKELSKVIACIDDSKFIGDALFSQWRYYNHWAETSVTEAKEWFLLMFERLREIAFKEKGYQFTH